MLIWDCKNAEEFIGKIVQTIQSSSKKAKSDVEWQKLSYFLTEDEKMYLIYCGKKYHQLKSIKKESDKK